MEATIRILRYNPEEDKKPHWEQYTIKVEPTDRVIDALHQIKWYHDGTLAVRRSCMHGICGSDAMVINGHNALACKVLMKNVGAKVTIEPLRGFRVIKDLVVDMDAFFAKYRSIMPYFVNNDPPPRRERLQSEEERDRIDDTTKCILCAACTTSCPSFWANNDYLGPAAIVQGHRFVFDSRDQAWQERLSILAQKNGVWRCRSIFNCVEACPREINIKKAIAEVQQAIVSGSRGF